MTNEKLERAIALKAEIDLLEKRIQDMERAIKLYNEDSLVNAMRVSVYSNAIRRCHGLPDKLNMEIAQFTLRRLHEMLVGYRCEFESL